MAQSMSKGKKKKKKKKNQCRAHRTGVGFLSNDSM